MAKILKVKEGDIGPKLAFTLKKPSGSVWNLTGATITVVISGGNTPTRLSKTGTITSATDGTCYYTLAAADTVVTGKYRVEVKFTYGTPITTSYITVTQGDLEIVEAL